MKKQIFTLAVIALSSLSFVSCRETVREETVVKEAENDRDVERVEIEVEEEDKGILERTGEKVDQEVNEEINEEIDQIGDDN